MARVALILGVFGQDGAYLSARLLESGAKIVGVGREYISENQNLNLRCLGVSDGLTIDRADLKNPAEVDRLIRDHAPVELYNLAGNSSVAYSFKEPTCGIATDATIAMNVFDAVRRLSPGTRVFQALSSEIFGGATSKPQTEHSIPCPITPYGYGKTCVKLAIEMYRELYGLQISGGILYNHESPLRGVTFVTRKITSGLAECILKSGPPMRLGNIDAMRDWGFAGDYTDAMIKILRVEAQDFIISTGRLRSVRDLCEAVARTLGTEIIWSGEALDETGTCARSGRRLIEIDSNFYRPVDSNLLLGDYSKAKQILDWDHSQSFLQLVRLLMDVEIKRLRSVPLRPADFWGQSLRTEVKTRFTACRPDGSLHASEVI